MKTYLLGLLLLVGYSCKTGPGLFGKKTLHEQYGQKLTDAGLKETTLGARWFAAAQKALDQPVTISLPYKETGYFAADAPLAAGLRFTAKRGQKLNIAIQKNPASGFILFLELWRIHAGSGPTLVQALDSAGTDLSFSAEDDETLLLRLQPQLLQSGDYTLDISVGPSLQFPVAGQQAKIGSFWGDSRDEGGRRHEGIDIFAPKRTPAIASATGVITSVTENKLGGRVVFLRPSGKNYSLYYAHLDEQLVQSGQRINTGDTVGLVGNTGNARTTPSHLHFGIYTSDGAIDPLAFVDREIKKAADVKVNPEIFQEYLRLVKPTTVVEAAGAQANLLAFGTAMKPLAFSSQQVRIQLPDGRESILDKGLVQAGTIPLKRVKLNAATFFYESPVATAPKKQEVPAFTMVDIIGYFNEFGLVQLRGQLGWILQTAWK
ncbi:MAG TPA: M23 family metallopeptidase [Flavisolibacter sp.]|jgi:murein DD-endopeptidase MepM/ murein hydrolase activator NlpD|nr:M23 family metallopeptidase [Flavisolibacter sp.]